MQKFSSARELNKALHTAIYCLPLVSGSLGVLKLAASDGQNAVREQPFSTTFMWSFSMNFCYASGCENTGF